MMLHNIILELKIVLLKNVQNEKDCDRAPATSGSARPPALSTFWPFPSRPNRTVVAGEKSQNQIEAVQCKCETRDRLEMWTLRLVTFFVDEHKIDDRRPCDPGLDGQRFKVASVRYNAKSYLASLRECVQSPGRPAPQAGLGSFGAWITYLARYIDEFVYLVRYTKN